MGEGEKRRGGVWEKGRLVEGVREENVTFSFSIGILAAEF